MAKRQNSTTKFWFKTKEYGWGWQPATWQGWCVLLFYIIFLFYASWVLLPNRTEPFESSRMLTWFGVVTASILSLIIIAWITGDKPQWRWGGPVHAKQPAKKR